MDRWQNRVAVVTGASSGIGAAIAKDLVEAGLIVVGLARRKERLDELRQSLAKELQPKLHPVVCDVTDLKAVNLAFDWIISNLGGVDVLVNNAGTHRPGQILNQQIEDIEQVMQTNVMGVVYCTKRAYRSMKERNFDGHVLIINSILGHNVFCLPLREPPTFGIYPATKYALTAITEILRQELSTLGTKIKITSISPGLVDTEIVPDEYKKLEHLEPKDISQGVLYAISTPPNVQVHELTIKPVGEIF